MDWAEWRDKSRQLVFFSVTCTPASSQNLHQKLQSFLRYISLIIILLINLCCQGIPNSKGTKRSLIEHHFVARLSVELKLLSGWPGIFLVNSKYDIFQNTRRSIYPRPWNPMYTRFHEDRLIVYEIQIK